MKTFHAVGCTLVLALCACSSPSPSTDLPAVPPAASASSVGTAASARRSSSPGITERSSAASEADSVPALEVPFSPQAPFANWDALHEESCEEMSLVMVKHFFDHASLSLQTAEDEIQDLIAWETDHGYGYDVTAGQIAEIAKAKYGMSARVIENPSIADIVKELAAGRPVIVPVAGRDLGNPYFSGAGPWYHMLVITGYKKGAFSERFVTNDPGTKRGEKYEYDASVLLRAIHDWTGVKEEIRQGARRVVVIDR